MRLIDADLLIEAIENIKLYNFTPGQPVYDMNRVRADELIETINNQPTAYDVETVVAELENSDKRLMLRNGNIGKTFYIPVNTAISIVRGKE